MGGSGCGCPLSSSRSYVVYHSSVAPSLSTSYRAERAQASERYYCPAKAGRIREKLVAGAAYYLPLPQHSGAYTRVLPPMRGQESRKRLYSLDLWSILDVCSDFISMLRSPRLGQQNT